MIDTAVTTVDDDTGDDEHERDLFTATHEMNEAPGAGSDYVSVDARLRPRLGAVTGGVLDPRGMEACLSGGRGALLYSSPPSESDLDLLDTCTHAFKENTSRLRRSRCAAVSFTRTGYDGRGLDG